MHPCPLCERSELNAELLTEHVAEAHLKRIWLSGEDGLYKCWCGAARWLKQRSGGPHEYIHLHSHFLLYGGALAHALNYSLGVERRME